MYPVRSVDVYPRRIGDDLNRTPLLRQLDEEPMALGTHNVRGRDRLIGREGRDLDLRVRGIVATGFALFVKPMRREPESDPGS